MGQMYKVFIEHIPVVFISEKDLQEKNSSIVFSESLTLKGDIISLLKNSSLDQPLQIVCENPKEDFKLFFKDFLKIKAAGGLVQRKQDFLLIKRNGKWDVPKGKMTKNESPEVACIREISEECGIYGQKINSPLVTTYHVMKYKGRLALKKTKWYMLSYNGPKSTVPARDEGITKAKWMSEAQMLSIRGNTYGSINEVLDAFLRAKISV
jgi:ADP-ribose pyrophosphatase YjhB (NUDIX family)